jgi:hypothetical protein
MNNRCAGLVVVLGLFVAFGTANADIEFAGVIDPRTAVTEIDSMRLVSPVQDMTFLTPGWGTHTPYDVFHFTGVPRWPETITLHGTVNGITIHKSIIQPQSDTWYPISMGVATSLVLFGSGGVEESKPGAERPSRLTVSPSVVTGHMTIRLQAVGTSRPVLEIHDAVGNVVRSLGCTARADGIATATWNREDQSGRLVPGGVYFCRCAAAGVIAVRKVLVAY